jgi:hypothetical protein
VFGWSELATPTSYFLGFAIPKSTLRNKIWAKAQIASENLLFIQLKLLPIKDFEKVFSFCSLLPNFPKPSTTSRRG